MLENTEGTEVFSPVSRGDYRGVIREYTYRGVAEVSVRLSPTRGSYGQHVDSARVAQPEGRIHGLDRIFPEEVTARPNPARG